MNILLIEDDQALAQQVIAQLSEEARRRHPNGRGLGLSIAEDVAERHGFELRLAKSEAGGLEVSITGELAPS